MPGGLAGFLSVGKKLVILDHILTGPGFLADVLLQSRLTCYLADAAEILHDLALVVLVLEVICYDVGQCFGVCCFSMHGRA